MGWWTVETVVKIVLSEIVTSVDKEVRIPTIEDVEEEQTRARTGTKGNDRREKHTTIQKSNVIDDFEAGVTHDELAVKYSINRSLVSKWMKNKSTIKRVAVSEYRNHTKIRPSTKYQRL